MSEMKTHIIFCNRNLSGIYKFDKIFELRPSVKLLPQPPVMGKYPIFLKVQSTVFDKSYDEKEWYEQQRADVDIVFELMTLLSTLTHDLFFHLPGTSSWFLPFEDEKFGDVSKWGQESYFGKLIEKYEPVTEEIKKIPFNDFYGQYARRLSTTTISFPDIIDSLFVKYFQLDPEDKEAFKRACIFFHKGLTFKDEGVSHSFSVIALVSTIEILLELKQKDDKTKVCETCGQPVYAVSRKFIDFMINHGPTGESYKKYVRHIYGLRSGFLHRGKMMNTDLYNRLELMDSVEIEYIVRTIRICLVNWLLKT